MPFEPTRPLSEKTDFQPDAPLDQAVTLAYEPLAFTVMTWVALPTETGTGKFGPAGCGVAWVFPAPPAAAVGEPLGVGFALSDGFAEAEAEGEADAEAEAELLGEEDELGASDVTLLAVAAAASAAGASWPWCPQADARNIAPVAASAAEKLRDEGSTK
jgi:hypothetical protein